MKYILFSLLFLLVLVVSGCEKTTDIDSFEDCVAAGNPVMESDPRQCTADETTFVEETQEEAVFTQCETEPDMCTREYDPVCGLVDNGVRCITTPCPSTDAVDFSNPCVACSEGAYGHYPGDCSDNLFVVCTEIETQFDQETFAEDANGICVDICPGNYDSYTTQTGIELCIPHYGKDDIAQWDLCSRSTENCSCVKTTETTTGQEIVDPQYRCVPEQYAERLLFRSGQDRLDEDGKQQVMIA